MENEEYSVNFRNIYKENLICGLFKINVHCNEVSGYNLNITLYYFRANVYLLTASTFS